MFCEKINHYTIFHLSNSLSKVSKAEDWYKLRTSPLDKDYFIPDDISDYQFCKTVVTEKVIELSKTNNINSILSIGSGKAHFEAGLKANSDLKITVSDHNDSIFLLDKFKIFDACIKINILEEDIVLKGNEALLMHRIDTEFSDEQLLSIFKKQHENGIKHIFFIPTQFLTLKSFLVEQKILLKSLLPNKSRTMCGWVRKKSLFDDILGEYYKVNYFFIHNKPLYYLTY